MNQPAPENSKSRSRPKLFRALGDSEPPLEIVIDDVNFRRIDIVKHDSWAATAVYESNTGKAACKFNRVQPIFGVPMKWLGALLAKRERAMYQRLGHITHIPQGYKVVSFEGKTLSNAAAHEYINGTPLQWHHRLSKQFFIELQSTVHELHQQGIAIVDLNKKENIIVSDDHKPYLIDFQISVRLPRFLPFSFILNILQQADRYHLEKHFSTLRPDMLPGFDEANYEINRPLWIRLHRKIAVPFRQLRRRLLVSLQVRTGDGKVQSEQFVETGLKQIAVHDDPLLSLFQLLASAEYFQSANRNNASFIEKLFVDLYGRKFDPFDAELIQILLDARKREEIVIQILRSPALFAVTQGLSDQWLREREKTIKDSLLNNSDHTLQIKAAA